MAILNVRSLGEGSISSDISPWDLPPNAINDGSNFRVFANKLYSVGGYSKQNSTPILSPNGGTAKIGHLRQSSDFGGASYWILFGDDSVQAYDGTNLFDITGSITPITNAERWSTAITGEVMFANHPSIGPFYWLEGNVQIPFNDLPWSPTQTWDDAGKSCNTIRAHKNFLFGLGMTENGEDYFDRVRWSHPAEPNGIPFSWEETAIDPSSLAGYVTLGGGGRIIGGQSLRDSFVVYSDSAVNIMDFVGDALGWRRRTVTSTAGLLSKESLIEVRGQHFFLSYDDILTFDGNQMVSLLHNRLRVRLGNRINQNAYQTSYAFENTATKEIWFCIPEGDALFPNAAYVFNYRDNSWGIRDLEQQYRHASFGNLPEPAVTWNSLAGTAWNEMDFVWDSGAQTPFNAAPFAVTSVDNIYDIDPNIPDENVSTVVSRTDLPLAGQQQVTTVTSIYPHVEGTAPINVYFGSQQTAGGPIRWGNNNQPVVFNPQVDRKIDLRTTGELHSWRFESQGKQYFRLSGFDIEYQPAGRR